MTTPEYQPPAWNAPAGPPQYPPYPGGSTPSGYPAQPSYPTQPQAYPPSQPQAYPPSEPGYPADLPPPPPAYPNQPQPYPPAYPQQPAAYPQPPAYPQQPTFTEQPNYGPPAEPPAPAPAPPPAKKSIVGKLGGILGSLLVIALVAGLKFGLVGVIQNAFGDGGGPSAPSNPFEGTLAASYPEGEAGIVLPTATEVAGFTEAEVAAALQSVKQAMIAGRLDERMLYDHDRSALRALFSPLGAEELDAWFDEKIGGVFATMIAPGYTLTDDPIRVSGTITFSASVVDEIRALEVHPTFVWVYPFTGKLETPGDHLVTVKDDLYWLFPLAEDVIPEAVGMYPDARSTSFSYNIDCALMEQDLVALGKPEFTLGGEDIDPDDVMDPNGTMDLPDTC